jgi:hypothetical protein
MWSAAFASGDSFASQSRQSRQSHSSFSFTVGKSRDWHRSHGFRSDGTPDFAACSMRRRAMSFAASRFNLAMRWLSVIGIVVCSGRARLAQVAVVREFVPAHALDLACHVAVIVATAPRERSQLNLVRLATASPVAFDTNEGI